MTSPPIGPVTELEALRGSRVLVYCTNDRVPKRLTAADVLAFSRVLHTERKSDKLDLVLHSHGGVIGAARALALQLRDYTSQLNILVPIKARSSATLLCLAANEIILTSSAEFSPIDPIIKAGADVSSSLPRRISSEDVRSFRAMAEEWFNLRSEESRVQVLALLTQRIFPSTLAAFYRSDQYVRRVAQELIEFQLPDRTPAQRTEIVRQLIAGYANHQDLIGYRDIIKLGLRAQLASGPEAKLMSRIVTGCQDFMNAEDKGEAKGRCRGVFLGRDSGLRFIVRAVPKIPGSSEGSGQFDHRRMWTRGEWVDVRPLP